MITSPSFPSLPSHSKHIPRLSYYISPYFWAQMNTRGAHFILFFILCISAGCANITAPTGGKKDKIPPKLVSIDPPDSLKNTRVKRIEMYFDEYITVSDPVKEVQLSPILSIAPQVTGLNKHVIVKIVDSLLENNTTYRLSFGNAIKDLHEGNAFAKYTYTFSTGPYFDSLQLRGSVTDALTGLYDLDGVVAELYYASDNDSAVVRHKPKYVAKVDATGKFVFKGLPKRTFRIYALKDANENLIYDGPVPGDMIGFADNTVVPNDTGMAPIEIRVFAEIPDTAGKKTLDSAVNKKDKITDKTKKTPKNEFTYSVNVDTSNKEKKTFDVTGPVKITFNRLPALNRDKITLAWDSSDVAVQVPTIQELDTVHRVLKVSPVKWKEDAVYTLRLVKGFAKDTAGSDLVPSRYTFHTMDEDNYGEVTMHLPGKYYNNNLYLFKVYSDADSIYQKPVKDTIIVLSYLKPGKYNFRIIVDKNKNGKWDTGDLLGKKQPEEVIPYKDGPLNVKAGYKYDQDFVQKPAPVPVQQKGGGPDTTKPK